MLMRRAGSTGAAAAAAAAAAAVRAAPAQQTHRSAAAALATVRVIAASRSAAPAPAAAAAAAAAGFAARRGSVALRSAATAAPRAAASAAASTAAASATAATAATAAVGGDASARGAASPRSVASTPAAAPAAAAGEYVSLREQKPFVIVGLGNFYHNKNRHSVGLRTIDLLVREHLGWSWQWHPKSRAWLSEGTVEIPGDELEGVLAQQRHVVFVKPATYMLRSNGVAARRACSYHKVRPENCLVVHFDTGRPVGHYGPAVVSPLPNGMDKEVADVPFLHSLKESMRIRDEKVVEMLRRFSIGVATVPGDESRMVYNFGMQHVDLDLLEEAYLNTKFTADQEKLWREYVLGNADHLLRSMLHTIQHNPHRASVVKSQMEAVKFGLGGPDGGMEFEENAFTPPPSAGVLDDEDDDDDDVGAAEGIVAEADEAFSAAELDVAASQAGLHPARVAA